MLKVHITETHIASPPASPKKKRIRTSVPLESISALNAPPLITHPVCISKTLQTRILDTIDPSVSYGLDNPVETRGDGSNTMSDTSKSSQMEENAFEKVMEEVIMEQPQGAQNNEQANNGGSTYQGYTSKGNYTPSPMLKDAKLALDDLTRILKPPRKTGAGYNNARLDSVLQKRLEGMEQFL